MTSHHLWRKWRPGWRPPPPLEVGTGLRPWQTPGMLCSNWTGGRTLQRSVCTSLMHLLMDWDRVVMASRTVSSGTETTPSSDSFYNLIGFCISWYEARAYPILWLLTAWWSGNQQPMHWVCWINNRFPLRDFNKNAYQFISFTNFIQNVTWQIFYRYFRLPWRHRPCRGYEPTGWEGCHSVHGWLWTQRQPLPSILHGNGSCDRGTVCAP